MTGHAEFLAGHDRLDRVLALGVDLRHIVDRVRGAIHAHADEAGAPDRAASPQGATQPATRPGGEADGNGGSSEGAKEEAGGALVAARRLHNFGAQVTALVTKPDESLAPIPREQLDILRNMGVAVVGAADVVGRQNVDIVVDGLIGYSLRGAPRGTAASLIRWANQQAAPVVSLDVPSGVDATYGAVLEPAVEAAATMTLALPKEGLRSPGIERNMGDLYLADISVPPELYERFLGIPVPPIFAESDLVQLV